MGRVRSYRELRVYREAFALAMEVFELAHAFPDHEKFDLARQIKRSSRSVCANTAEAWRRRRYPAAMVAKVVDAEAEASETRVHIEFAHACGYLTAEIAADLDARYDRLLARLTAMRTRPEKWVPRVAQRRSPHSQAPANDVGSHRRRSAAANSAQADATEPAVRPERKRRREPPSSLEHGIGGSRP